jgi:hypothetical protein
MADCVQKGRNNPPRGEQHGSIIHPERVPRGEGHWNSKLNAAKVLEIRRLARQGMTQTALARQFLVHHSVVGQIVRCESWRHI